MMEDDSEQDNLLVEFRGLILASASSKLDILTAKNRKLLIERIEALLREHPPTRTLLAEWNDLKCSSSYAYRRIIPLYVFCLLQIEQIDEAKSSLAHHLLTNLTRLLERASEPNLVETCCTELVTSPVKSAFAEILHDDLAPTFLTAVALGSALDTAAAAAAAAASHQQEYSDWLNLLLQCSLSVFSSSQEMQTIKVFLSQITAEQWKDTVSPALQLKLKSHPDKALETVHGWIVGINKNVATLTDDEWMSSILLKQLQSSKDDNRQWTSRLLIAWAARDDGAVTCMAAAVFGGGASKAAWAAPARSSLYETMEQIAIDISADRVSVPDNKVVETILEGLISWLVKETGKAEHKLAGQQALVEWMVIAKRYKEESGYRRALEYIQTPVINKKTSDVGPLLGLLVLRLHPDALESLAVDLWSAKWEKGLEALVNAASSKKSAHIEGLFATYFTLLYASQSGKALPTYAVNVMSAGSSSKESTSFLFSMADVVPSNQLVALVLPRTMALYTQLAAKRTKESLPSIFPQKKISCAARAMAVCMMHPASTSASLMAKKDQYASNAILASLETVLTYEPNAAEGLVQALFEQVNQSALEVEEMVEGLNATREARESDSEPVLSSVKGQGSVNASHSGFDASAVRRVARVLSRRSQNPRILARVMVLMHAGSSLRSEGHQRAALIVNTLRVTQDVLLPLDEDGSLRSILASEIASLSANHCLDQNGEKKKVDSKEASKKIISGSMHEAALSLITSIGGIACNFSPKTDDVEDEDMKPYVFASKLCIENLAPLFSERLDGILKEVESLPERDIDLYLSPPGVIYKEEDKSRSEPKRTGGRRMSEDEEWELQMKMELAAKRKKETPPAGLVLSPEEQKLLEQQDRQRQDLSSLLQGDLVRVLDSIQHLCGSDMEVGNECLPAVMESVLATALSSCPAVSYVFGLRAKSLEVLIVLATCVYEILETHAPTLAQAVLISCRQKEDGDDSTGMERITGEPKARLVSSALPSPCAPAACVIYEVDNLHDSLSGGSFAFLFPVIRASLMGPRTAPGCEASLRVLERHTFLLAGDMYDATVATLRRDMAISVLELLRHDRAQTFQNPSPFDTLVACYRTDPSVDTKEPAFSTTELAPLLDERGALGPKSCRAGAMLVLAHVAEHHKSLVKNNPLIENRVWLNCFEKDEEVRKNARRAWLVIQDAENVDENDASALPAPSPLFAAPLLPLLSHVDDSIARAAADAYATAMGKRPSSVARNVEMLCETYIDSFPSSMDEDDKVGSASTPSRLPAPSKPKPSSLTTGPPKKKATSITGHPKKKPAVKKSALAVAGIGRPKTTKKKVVSSALLKPKQERILDQEALENQFKTSGSKKKDEEKDSSSKVAVRLGVVRAIAAITSSGIYVEMDEPSLKLLTSFLMAYGIAERDDVVRGAARNALRDFVASYGGTDQAIAFLLPHLEAVLKTGDADETVLGSLPVEKVPRKVAASDRRKEGVVVALGSVALHLKGPENEAKIDGTIDMLISTLKTPSEDVQSSVADALTKLMKKGHTQDRIESIVSGLLNDCLHGDTLAVQRGAAYGLSAAVKGSGIATLKKFDIVKKLEEACSSGSSKCKEGSLFAIELLSDRLGLLFEPYVILLLPSLLKSFSDSSDHVRKAAGHTTGLIMSKLSAHGVKLVMPAVLSAFNDPAWRTKEASIRMLGAMSHLAPKQLASALPKVVPKLTEAFSDTHPKVKASAQESLNEISTVIRNPEISSISPVLLKALTDPADYTIKALETLIETEFLHAIDAPSLALIVPILHRGLRDRGATTKRYGGLIAGNICTMINDPKDFVPYLPTLLPDLQSALLDPIPDVRATAAKALGSLTRSLGDQILPELRPWLVKRLRDDGCSSAERSGAAQGLTEVLIASGSNVVEDVMRNELLPLRSSPEASTREGVLWMLTFLPPAMGQGFAPLIDATLPALITGLSDDSEPVRDVALRAGRVLIRTLGKVHVDKILPKLEEGLGHEDYRIRVASLSLLGDLLSSIGGTQLVKGEGDTQDDIRKAERAQAQIALVLGAETRRRVLSGLFLARSDSVHVVRQSALQVWKTVVSVTGRTLRDILSPLVSRIIDDLASGNEDKTVVAGRCLGEVVSKLGESVLPQIIPVLRNALYDGDEHTKRGVCVGLTEVIKCSTKDQILRFLEIIVKVVQDALCDDSESVRRMAATSFQSLHAVVGTRAFDEIVPSLMVALESGDSDENTRTRALNGLTGILSVRSRELLPYIVPRLIARPMTLDHAKALSGIAGVTESTLHMHFSSIIPALLRELADDRYEYDDGKIEVIRDCCRSICRSVDEAGVNILVSEIASKCGSDKPSLRRESCWMLEVVITERAEKKDFYEQIPIILRELLYRLNDEDPSVLKATNQAFTALSKCVPADELVKHVEFMRNLIASMVSDARRRKGGVGDREFLLPGFNMPKGLDPLLPIYQRGILYGNPEIRETSAAGLGEVIELTSTKYLAGPLVVKMTGPLLRIVGDRNPSNVKVAILKTLGLILVKGGPALRAFVPQFQTTFVKALSDPSRQVRNQAIEALSLLMPLSTRVDPLIKELVAGSLGKNLTTEGLAASAVQTATLEALAIVLQKGGTKAKLPASVPSALDASKELLTGPDDGIREAAAKVMGEACALLPAEVTLETIQAEIIDSTDDDSNARHGKACAIRRILVTEAGSKVESAMPDLEKLALGFLNDDKSIVREAGCVALGAVIGCLSDPKTSFAVHEADLLKILGNSRESMDLHRAMARGLCVALNMIEGSKRLDSMGLPLVDACLQLALSGSQRIQFAYNDVLWLALDVASGQEGLDRYSSAAVFDNVRTMKSLYSKVLSKSKEVTILND